MPSLESTVDIRVEILKEECVKLSLEIKDRQKALEIFQNQLFEEQMKQLHIKEVFRLAKLQFPRLRGEKSNMLSTADVAELEKWLKRAKTTEGIKDIIDAIKELQKYYKADVKTNLYALVQKIIIGGAIHSKRNKK